MTIPLLYQRSLIEVISKKSFCPIRRSKMPLAVRRTSIGVEPSSQVLDILEYASGLTLGLVLISNENPNFEITSIKKFPSNYCEFACKRPAPSLAGGRRFSGRPDIR